MNDGHSLMNDTLLYPWGKFGDPLSSTAPATVDRRPPNGLATANGTSATSITGRPARGAGATVKPGLTNRVWWRLMTAYVTVYVTGLVMISVGIYYGNR